ncbi:cytochrome c oxidase subunit 5b-1, mitochondrial isoform X2 [Malania oleifera]|uniref:cytochrome c oxidase subunit 5b-1, mitochondrial isoform X2 n=1 Tax=Malania oleifera TaxID=397392 RepID=UPI0025ADBCD8|nr:cytochrome c oxidase subunit 5b-1, mitochondrial isoform X2 [Malania oleifera]
MWRRLSSHLQTLAPRRSLPKPSRFVSGSAVSPSPLRRAPSCFSRYFSSDSDSAVSKEKKRIEDVMPIATGHEREELEAELEGRNILDINYPAGPFGTKESPAVVKSVYNKRIVGCPGGEGEDEHDVVWFWLEKDKPHECPVCSQYFVLEVVGAGGDPDGHDDHH